MELFSRFLNILPTHQTDPHPSELLAVPPQTAESIVKAFEDLGGRQAVIERLETGKEHYKDHFTLEWASEAWGYKMSLENNVFVIKQALVAREQMQYLAGQLNGQRLLEGSGCTKFAPYSPVEGNLNRYLVQRWVEGSPMTDRAEFDALLEPYHLKFAGKVARDGIYSPQFGPVLIDLSTIYEISNGL